MGRGARTETGVALARRGSAPPVRPAEVLSHQQVSEAEALVIRAAEERGVVAWEVSGEVCRELTSDSATEVPLTALPLPVALEAWCTQRLDFDHLIGALTPERPLLPDSAYVAFPDLLELL